MSGLPRYNYVLVQALEGGHVVLIQFNRPHSANSLLPGMLSETLSAMEWADEQPDVRVIVLSATGNFFNTGLDLVNSEGMTFALGSDFHQLNQKLILSDKILVAAVNGPAAGYGVTLLALFDLVYAVPEAYFFTPFVKWGMAPEGASSFSFPRIMGHQRAAALFLTGERITAENAQQLGLVNKIVSTEELLPKTLEIAKKLGGLPPGSLQSTKRLMKGHVRKQLLEANDEECSLIHNERYRFAEYEEAVKVFDLERREKQGSRGKI